MKIAIIKRPDFTVVTTDGRRYGASSLQVCSYEGSFGVAFMCSGEMTFVPSDEIAEIDFDKDGATHCGFCSNQLTSWPANYQPEWIETADSVV